LFTTGREGRSPSKTTFTGGALWFNMLIEAGFSAGGKDHSAKSLMKYSDEYGAM